MRKICLLLTLASAASAQAVFDLDASQSRAAFTLSDVLHTVHGSFKVKRGSIHFDPSGEASGEIAVDATSGESGSGARDKKMHQSVLESQKFPEIVFVPSRVRGAVNAHAYDGKVEIDGTFTIHGASHPLTASATVVAAGDRLQTKVHFVVPYVSWGMKNPSTLFLKVGETVDIDLDASGHVTWR